MSKAARAQSISPISRPRDRVHTTLHASDQGTRTRPSVRRTIDERARELFARSCVQPHKPGTIGSRQCGG
eukprot:1689934-Prymnesium_polylepis.1